MAFTYLIGWSKLNKWYYGASWKKEREPDVVEVRKLFEDSKLLADGVGIEPTDRFPSPTFPELCNSRSANHPYFI